MSFPNFPGIPPLSRNQAIAGGALLASTGLQTLLDKLAPAWGIYKAGGVEKAITPDNFLGIEYVNSQHVSNYPIEKGAFASFNKVQNPFGAVVRISKGGSKADRATFLDTLESLLASTELLWLIAEDKQYKNVTIERFDYRRDSSGGAGIIVASVHFLEIREAIATKAQTAGQPSTTAAPASAQAPVGNGQVQSQAVTTTPGAAQ